MGAIDSLLEEFVWLMMICVIIGFLIGLSLESGKYGMMGVLP